MISLQFKLTEKEYEEYFYYMCWSNPGKKVYRLKYFTTLSLFSIAAMTGVLFILDNNGLTNFSLIILCVFAVIITTTLPSRMKSVFRAKARKQIASTPDSIIPDTTLLINNAGITAITPLIEIKYNWDTFKNKFELNSCYYLYINEQRALVIPFRSFVNNQDKDSFEALLKEKIAALG